MHPAISELIVFILMWEEGSRSHLPQHLPCARHWTWEWRLRTGKGHPDPSVTHNPELKSSQSAKHPFSLRHISVLKPVSVHTAPIKPLSLSDSALKTQLQMALKFAMNSLFLKQVFIYSYSMKSLENLGGTATEEATQNLLEEEPISGGSKLACVFTLLTISVKKGIDRWLGYLTKGGSCSVSPPVVLFF